MKLSYNWLNDFVDLSDISLEKLAEELTMSAFEVEGIETTGNALGNDVVLGQIKEIIKHPEADKLQITQTQIGFNNDGTENIQQIVCGASNIAVGQLVPVATVGSKVINRHDGTEFQIKKSKIRGVESLGMLCSPDELGLSEAALTKIKEKQADGIYILETTEKIGTPIAKVLNQKQDYVLDVGARSNRGDALSVYGQAREIAAIFRKNLSVKLHSQALHLEAFQTGSETLEFDTSVKSIKPEITDSKDCQLFYTIAIEGIEIKESPQWLQDRISAMGINPINNVVDISNYVLLELGQPMHFYDRAKIAGDSLTVRRAQAGEKILTLDESEEELTEINLVIADGKGPSSLAGVMGGMDSSITDTTKDIVIEVAVFDPATVRKSSRAAGIESESKRRFERGVDKAMSKTALLRAVDLLKELASPVGAQLKLGEILVAGSEDISEQSVSLRTTEIKRHLGIDIESKQAIDLLDRLGIKYQGGSDSKLKFSIPSFRQIDITREADLIEELGRLYGFSNIPAQKPVSTVAVLQEQDQKQKTMARLRQAFVAAGFAEACLSSLIGDSLTALDAIPAQITKAKRGNSIAMDNPLSREHCVLRQSMLPALIQAASRNYAYDKTIDIKLFELGKIYHFIGDAGKATANDAKEENKVGAIMVKTEADWTQSKTKTLAENFFYFKTIIENLYPRAKFQAIDANAAVGDLRADSFVHPGISAVVLQDNRCIGLIAKLHPSLAAEWDLPDETYILELDHPKLAQVKFKPIASTPITERDITVDSNDQTNCEVIQSMIEKSKLKDLKGIKLLSLYRRADEETVSKSSTFRLKFQSETETLSGEEIDQEIAKLKSKLEAELGVAFRV
ncbi:MAG: phenylalanine--tRNA ligase subunit beta [Candidatus Melainabacteria bacterium]|jgi:phenylalanyl-tRNA synthetase beta chain|nr:phenylalanine--tRNA ligase subunit beta [Candidatus Melainabacteria bacterium]